MSFKSVFLHVTKACDLRCAYCYFSADTPMPGEMSAREYAALWPQLAALRPGKLVVTGGEPLLRPDLLELLRGLRAADPERAVTLALNTNGRRLDERLAGELVGLVDEVRVSLDGPDAVHDALRGAGTAAAARRALALLRETGFIPKVLVTATRASLPHLPGFLCELSARGYDRVNVNLFRELGRGADDASWRVSVPELRAALAEARRRLRPGEPPLPEPSVDAQSRCGAGRFLNILPDGSVYPCHALVDPRFACGNVRREPLASICRRGGLLERLAALDYRELGAVEPELSGLTRPGACLGEAHAASRALPFWDRL